MSDRALLSALDEIHTTRQRRVWGPMRRFSSRGKQIRPVLALAAVVLVSVIGLTLLPLGGFRGGLGGPPPTPSPSPTATPSSLTVRDMAPVDAGTYVTADPFLVRVTFTLPGGWGAGMLGPYSRQTSIRPSIRRH